MEARISECCTVLFCLSVLLHLFFYHQHSARWRGLFIYYAEKWGAGVQNFFRGWTFCLGGGVWKLIFGGGSNSPAPPRKSVYAITKHWVLVIVQFLICNCPPVWEYFNTEEYPKLAVTTSVYLWCYSECASTPGKLKIWLGQGGNRTCDLLDRFPPWPS